MTCAPHSAAIPPAISHSIPQRQVQAKIKMPLTICSSPVYAISAYSGVCRKTLLFWKPCEKRMIEAGPIAKLFQVLKIWNFSKPIPQNDQIHPSNAPQNPTKLRHNPSNLSPNPTNLVSKYDSPAPGSDAKDRTEALSGTSSASEYTDQLGLRVDYGMHHNNDI